MTLTVMLIISVLCDLVQMTRKTTDVECRIEKCFMKVFGVFSLVTIGYMIDKAVGTSWLHEVVECLCLMVEGAEILNDEETTL